MKDTWRDILTILSLFLLLVAVLAGGLILAEIFNVPMFSNWMSNGDMPVKIPN